MCKIELVRSLEIVELRGVPLCKGEFVWEPK